MLPRLPWRTLALIVLLILFLVPLPGIQGPLWRVLEDAAHVFIFAALAPLLAAWLRSTRLLANRSNLSVNACAWGLAVAWGLAIEILQSLSGRDASWSDLLADALGAASGLLAQAAWQLRAQQHHKRWLMAAASLATLLIGCWPLGQQLAAQFTAQRALPVLLGDTTAYALHNLEQRSASIDRVAAQWRIQFRDEEPWPGITFEGWPRNWRGYRTLILDLENPDGNPVEIGLVVRDTADTNSYDNRFNTAFALPPGAQRMIVLPLEEIARTPGGRKLNLGRVCSVSLFRTQGAGRALLVRAVRLQP